MLSATMNCEVGKFKQQKIKSIAQPATTKWNVSVRSYEIGVQQARSKARELVRPRNPFSSASFTLLNLEC